MPCSMRAVLGVVVALVIGGCSGGSGEINVDCGTPPDFAAWREATARAAALKEGEPEQVRRRVAAHLTACGTIDGKSQTAVLDLLGPGGLPKSETPRDERNEWEFYLGPDGLKLDSEVMIVVFDRHRRVEQVIVAQS